MQQGRNVKPDPEKVEADEDGKKKKKDDKADEDTASASETATAEPSATAPVATVTQTWTRTTTTTTTTSATPSGDNIKACCSAIGAAAKDEKNAAKQARLKSAVPMCYQTNVLVASGKTDRANALAQVRATAGISPAACK
jgi:hypothetical protein